MPILETVFEANTAFHGGAVSSVNMMSMAVVDSTFEGNTAHGGAIVAIAGASSLGPRRFSGVHFLRNKVDSIRHGVVDMRGDVLGASLTVEASTFEGNEAPSDVLVSRPGNVCSLWCERDHQFGFRTCGCRVELFDTD